MFYGAAVWDPVLITAQIADMQSRYWLALFLLTSLGDILFWRPMYISNMFNPYLITPFYLSGVYYGISYLLAAVFMAWSCVHVVERAKKVIDFAITWHFIHLIMVILVSGLPFTWWFWLAFALSVLVHIVLAEFLCMRRELKEIPLNGAIRVPERSLSESSVNTSSRSTIEV
jgi:protein SYS1